MELRVISPRLAEVQRMFDALDQHHRSYCPPQVCHLTTASELEREGCCLLGAFTNQGLCGIGGLKLFADYGEITRMFVDPEHRGQGIAERILDELIRRARAERKGAVRLETSDSFAAAMKLYLKSGFTRCAPFGAYVSEPYNTYLEKLL